MTESIITKICNCCEQTKDATSFYVDKRHNTLRQPCKNCQNTRYNTTKLTDCPVAIDLPNEEWRVCPLFTDYAISSLGRVKRLTAGQGTWAERVITPHPDKDGYHTVHLHPYGLKKVHRLVCFTFHGEPPSPTTQVNHKDGIKTNNIVENVEWCTHQENMTHAKRNGLRPVGEATPHSKLKAQDIPVIRQLLADGVSCAEIGRRYSVADVSIWNIKHRKSWAHLP